LAEAGQRLFQAHAESGSEPQVPDTDTDEPEWLDRESEEQPAQAEPVVAERRYPN
jgi:hypothetical protein